MAWNPDENIPDSPLTKIERQDTRRVLRWFERREFMRLAVSAWAKWIVGLPFLMLSVWQLVQLMTGHVK
jgi:hypothetical protein